MGDRHQFGISGLSTATNDKGTTVFGLFGAFAWHKKLVHMIEADVMQADKRTIVGFNHLGYHINPALVVYLQQAILSVEQENTMRYDIGARWLAYRGWDLNLEVTAIGNQEYTYPVKILVHLYL